MVCNDCVSATHPFHATKHPRQRWCSKISQFVVLDGYCDLFMARGERFKKIQSQINSQPTQLEMTFDRSGERD